MRRSHLYHKSCLEHVCARFDNVKEGEKVNKNDEVPITEKGEKAMNDLNEKGVKGMSNSSERTTNEKATSEKTTNEKTMNETGVTGRGKDEMKEDAALLQ